jgi:hypothetical protein
MNSLVQYLLGPFSLHTYFELALSLIKGAMYYLFSFFCLFIWFTSNCYIDTLHMNNTENTLSLRTKCTTI